MGCISKISKLTGYFKVASPEVETTEHPPAAVTPAEPGGK